MNIYICGLARTGKTTLAKKIKERFPNMNLFVSEAIRNGFQAMDEENAKAWGNKNSKQRNVDFPKFLKEFLVWNKQFSNCDNIVDLALLPLEKVLEIKEENDIILCLGFGGKSTDKIISTIRSYENKQDYTTDLTNEKMLMFWGNIEQQDKTNIKLCKENNILYFDTTEDRTNIQSKIIEYIKEKL